MLAILKIARETERVYDLARQFGNTIFERRNFTKIRI
jgi:hypothetical protein